MRSSVRNFHVQRRWGAYACLLAGSLGADLRAQSSAQEGSATLAPVTVTANPLGASEQIAPVSALDGEELTQRAQSTLGQTLDGMPGVSSTYFGPNASRPVIRGLDGERIRLLNNGAATSDLSGQSYDHAVPMDPLVMERIEVLRGPGALQYGGSAVGGVVNVIDNRIPREPQFDAQGGISGKADANYTTGNRGRSGAAVLEAGNERYTVHVDMMSREARDMAVPINLSCQRQGVTTVDQRLCNSAAESWGAALGASIFGDDSYLGFSMSTYDSVYGTVAEDAVTIDMKSTRLAVEGEKRRLSGAFQSLKVQASRTEYQHTELDAGNPLTQFRRDANDLRVQARHAPLGPLEGVLGLQLESSDYAADGATVLAPFSRTRQAALFVYEELPRAWGKLSFGLRTESVQVESMGHPQVNTFAVGQRNFQPRSYALGSLWQLAPAWQLSGNLSSTQRAPRDYEMFVNGYHVATNTTDIGNPDLALERSLNLDLGLAWKQGADRAQLQAFVHEFDNYIGLMLSDASTNPPTYRYSQMQARFRGLEASSDLRLLSGPQRLDLALRGDVVRADNLSTGQALPRIAPMRLGATFVLSEGPWSARVGADRLAAQDRVPEGQLATAGYTLWHAGASYRTKVERSTLLWYARLENIGNTLAYSASSILTQSVPGRAPLPGRSLRVGLQATF
jgi:iron complex outermembrane receptor protein